MYGSDLDSYVQLGTVLRLSHLPFHILMFVKPLINYCMLAMSYDAC